MSENPLAADVRRKAAIGTSPVSLQVEPGCHTRHRIYLAAELRHEEAVHHVRRSQAEAQRHAGGHNETVEACDTFGRIDEQPFPVERNDLDIDRRNSRLYCFGRVEFGRTDPGDTAEKKDDKSRGGPGDAL